MDVSGAGNEGDRIYGQVASHKRTREQNQTIHSRRRGFDFSMWTACMKASIDQQHLATVADLVPTIMEDNKEMKQMQAERQTGL